MPLSVVGASLVFPFLESCLCVSETEHVLRHVLTPWEEGAATAVMDCLCWCQHVGEIPACCCCAGSPAPRRTRCAGARGAPASKYKGEIVAITPGRRASSALPLPPPQRRLVPSSLSAAFPVTTPEPLVLVTPPRCLTANRTQQGVLLSWLPPANHSFPIDRYIMEFRVAERWEILDDAILGTENEFFAKDLSQVSGDRPDTAPAVCGHCAACCGPGEVLFGVLRF